MIPTPEGFGNIVKFLESKNIDTNKLTQSLDVYLRQNTLQENKTDGLQEFYFREIIENFTEVLHGCIGTKTGTS